MKEKIVKYRLFEAANKLNEIVSSEIKKNVFKKRHNLSGEVSSDGGIEISNSVSFVMFKPNLGPLVKLNFTCVNSNTDGTESNLKLERINGATFYLQYWGSLIFSVITLGVGVYQVIQNGTDQIEVFFLPIFGIGYHYMVRLIANGSTNGLISKVERMMSREKIKYKKL